jgi:4-hydroxybenzoate polyprenyltransferase/phosphoserine phosphatase
MQPAVKQGAKSVSKIPLVLGLDGTLTKVNTLQEAFVQLLSKQPLQALRALFMLRRSRAAFKAAIADHILPDAEMLPMHEGVLEAIKQARDDGRRVYLATAADERFAKAIADQTGVDGVFASKNGTNLKGKVKAVRLVAAFGPRGFDYIGNNAADIPVWHAARIALIAGARHHLVQRLNDQLSGVTILDRRAKTIWPYVLTLRPHQWLKNILLALPAVGAHDASIGAIYAVLIAIASFSLGASSVYIVNDMLDVPVDRAHPEKRCRPLAAGILPLSDAVVLLGLTGTVALALALALPLLFLLVLGVYVCFSISYSFYLKRKLMIDVVALAALYGLRVWAGSVATGIALTDWLIGFCFFLFLSLAMVKRATEVMALAQSEAGNIKGRGYRRSDLPILDGLMIASGFVGVLVLALYINSPEVVLLYHRPQLLWGICVILVYWLGRMFFLTGRGEMRQDPVIFAATDWISLLSGALIATIFLVAL